MEDDQLSESSTLFLQAYQDVINKKVSNINPNIFRTFDEKNMNNNSLTAMSQINPNRPDGFVQQIPKHHER